MLTPDMQLDMFGHEVQRARSTSLKPSPFTQVVDNRKKKVQVAVKARPVLFEPSLEETAMIDADAATALDIPRVSRVYQLDLPVRTQPVVYHDSTPLGASERDKKFVVIN